MLRGRVWSIFAVAAGTALYVGYSLWSVKPSVSPLPRVMDRRCRGGCDLPVAVAASGPSDPALLLILPVGPAQVQLAAGILFTDGGVAVNQFRDAGASGDTAFKFCEYDGGLVELDAGDICVETRGILVEGGTSTHFGVTEFSPSWGDTGAAVSAGTSMDGTSTAILVDTGSGTSAHKTTWGAFDTTAGDPGTFSSYFKAGLAGAGFVSLSHNSATNYAVVEISTCTICDEMGTHTAVTHYAGGGWCRLAFSQLAPSDNPSLHWAYGDTCAHAVPTTSWTGVGGTVIVDKPQYEKRSYASSAVRNTATNIPIVRTADSTSVPNALTSGSNFCIPYDMDPEWSTWPGGATYLVAAGVEDDDDTWKMYISSGALKFRITDHNGDANTFNGGTVSAAAHHIRVCDAAGTITAFVDGSPLSGTTTGSGTGTVATQPATLWFGQTDSLSGHLYGWLNRICGDTTGAACH